MTGAFISACIQNPSDVFHHMRFKDLLELVVWLLKVSKKLLTSLSAATPLATQE